MARTATMEKKYIKNFKPNTSRPLITIKCNISLDFIHYLFNNEYVPKVLTRTKKATNVDVTAFVAFLVEHYLYRFLCTFVKNQSQQEFSAF